MSLTTHVAVLAVVIIDLIFGAPAVGRFGGGYAATAFEFVIILGYVIFVLQWGVPWGKREKDDSYTAKVDSGNRSLLTCKL